MMLLAVVLLSGASAFAQSESETLKGDVNEDGVVDVADINAIIEIMKAEEQAVDKYYLGVISDDDMENQTAVNNLIANSTTTTSSALSSITLPSGAPSNNGYEHIFIYNL